MNYKLDERDEYASDVTRVESKDGGLEVACELEGGLQRIYSIALPAVLTIQFGANTPRYAPLPAIMKAARQPIKELSPAALGLASWDAVSLPYTFGVRGLSPPAAKGHAEMIAGTVEEQARQLAHLLRDKGFARRWVDGGRRAELRGTSGGPHRAVHLGG